MNPEGPGDFSYEKRAMLAIALTMILIVVWSKYFGPKPPPPGTETAPVATATPATAAPPAATSVSSAPATTAAIQAAAEQTLIVESPLYHVELSNRGGLVRSWQLRKYLTDENPPRPLDLVNADVAKQLGAWPFSLALDDPALEAAANSGLYQMTPAVRAGSAVPLTAPVQVSFHWSDGHLDVTKRLKFGEDYLVHLEVSATLDGKPLPAAVAWRGGFGDRAAQQAAQRGAIPFLSRSSLASAIVFYSEAGKLNALPASALGVKDHREERQKQGGLLEYAGIEDQFFAAAFIPDAGGVSVSHWQAQASTNPENPGEKQAVAEMAAGTSVAGPLELRAYVGPKDLKVLAHVQPPLDGLVQFGWWGVLAKPMLEILEWVHRYVPNYGWAIVVFTLMLTMVLFPIRIWTYRSMKKMQKVAPEVRAIQDRYKKYSMRDPRKQKMQEEIMAVYNREGINPMGSCLPMLVQFPFLLAFYRMLMGAIELRHAPWIFWIHDLSARDPYYVLPVLMAGTSYMVQKMTPMAGVDPAQKKTMQFMNLFFILIFAYLSSGLNLYYFTSNLVGAVQQYYLMRSDPPESRSKWKNKPKTA